MKISQFVSKYNFVVIMANPKIRYNLVRISCFPKPNSRSDYLRKKNDSIAGEKNFLSSNSFTPIHSRKNWRESSLNRKKHSCNQTICRPIFRTQINNQSITENAGCGIRTFALSSTKTCKVENRRPERRKTIKIIFNI